MNTPPQNGKDVIYVDVDDEITAIIDKVRSSGQKIVALVLPKRATVMQSIVNMKLLKRTADRAKKHIVLITSEASLLPLAGVAGVHVAKTPQSRPEIPAVPAGMDMEGEETVDEIANAATAAFTGAPAANGLDPTRPIGEYAGPAMNNADEDESIELDEDAAEEAAQADGAPAAAPAKPKKDKKKFKIPDFNRFRLLLILGGAGVVGLIVFLYFALAVMPKATVLVHTDSASLDTSFDVALNTDATSVDLENEAVPAKLEKTVKTATQTVDATGSLNKGTKAVGTVTVTNCSGGVVSLPAGTGFSADGMTFISQKSAVVPKSNYDFVGGGFKCKNDGKANLEVAAQKAGAAYNLGPRDYSIANSPDNVKATGTEMAGGTDNIVKVITQADVDNATGKIDEQDTDAIAFEIQDTLLKEDKFPVKETFTTTPSPEVTTSAAVGSEATQVTVTQKTTYTMLGAAKADLQKLIGDKVKSRIDTHRQSILDYGLSGAAFKVQNQTDKSAVVTLNTTAIAGSVLNLGDLKRQIAGKKASEAQTIIKQNPGVTNVDVKYSPFWVSSIPKKTSKITLTVEKPQSNNASN